MAAVASAIEEKSGPLKVDREKTCPFLLRIFWKEGGHHRLDEFEANRTPTTDELQIYTWRDATLSELSSLIQQIVPTASRPNARLSFRLIFYDNNRNRHIYKDLGMVMNSKTTAESSKTLEDARFVTGDYIDVNVFTSDRPQGLGITGRARNDRFGERRDSFGDSGFGRRDRFEPRGNGWGRPHGFGNRDRDDRPPKRTFDNDRRGRFRGDQF
ncbi:hypothetical protein BZG36_02981 [Bifiguratus adelaidae]|uniref:Histone deacetylase complex subunit SAP18 n=1 Tax=Bifiguratus adelaidae TaxID=1938954 RepID=A0A261XYC1_9FUNG|nr:hypothetical protein BZG36_02981 [Bifiguratus adelaidae]